jgi:hypothetical protein
VVQEARGAFVRLDQSFEALPQRVIPTTGIIYKRLADDVRAPLRAARRRALLASREPEPGDLIL